MDKDIRVQTTATTGDDGLIRTAVVVKENGLISVDVVTADGRRLCLLNISSWVHDKTRTVAVGCVDVIVDKTTQLGTFIAENNNHTQFREERPNNNVMIVDISAR